MNQAPNIMNRALNVLNTALNVMITALSIKQKSPNIMYVMNISNTKNIYRDNAGNMRQLWLAMD